MTVAIILRVSNRPEVFTKKLMCDLLAQSAAIDKRMMVMESSVNARPKDFFKEVAGGVERVGVYAVRERQTVNDDSHVRSAEIALD